MKKGYHILVVLLFCIILALTGCSSKKPTGTTEETEGKSSGESRKLTIIHVNDVHGNAEESDTAIGYAKFGAFVDTMIGNGR